jgi:hypothetical protein
MITSFRRIRANRRSEVGAALWIPACAGMTVPRFLPDRLWRTVFSRSRDCLPGFAWRYLGQRRLNLQSLRWRQAPTGSCRTLRKMCFPASPNTAKPWLSQPSPARSMCGSFVIPATIFPVIPAKAGIQQRRLTATRCLHSCRSTQPSMIGVTGNFNPSQLKSARCRCSDSGRDFSNCHELHSRTDGWGGGRLARQSPGRARRPSLRMVTPEDKPLPHDDALHLAQYVLRTQYEPSFFASWD